MAYPVKHTHSYARTGVQAHAPCLQDASRAVKLICKGLSCFLSNFPSALNFYLSHIIKTEREKKEGEKEATGGGGFVVGTKPQRLSGGDN